MVLIKGKQIKASSENYLSETYESSHSEVVCEKYALKNIGKLLGKWLCQSLYFNPLRANPIKSQIHSKNPSAFSILHLPSCEIERNNFDFTLRNIRYEEIN